MYARTFNLKFMNEIHISLLFFARKKIFHKSYAQGVADLVQRVLWFDKRLGLMAIRSDNWGRILNVSLSQFSYLT